MLQRVELPSYRIVVEFDPDRPGAGTITSELKSRCPFCNETDCNYTCEWSRESDEANTESPDQIKNRLLSNAAIDGLEAMVLASACAGLDIESPAFLEAVESAADAIFNHFD